METLHEQLEKRLDAIEKRLADIDLAAENMGGRPVLIIQHVSLEELIELEAKHSTRSTKDYRG